MSVFFSSSALNTKKAGEILGREFLKMPKMKTALALGLQGDLGSGKTTFLQGFAKGLGIKGKIISPTFVLIRRFQFKNSINRKFKDFYHIDCYRLGSSKEILKLGFKKIISNPENIVAVEWVDRIIKSLPKNNLILNFETSALNKRMLRLCYNKKKMGKFKN
ncbi:MAG: tRNA (adenosine(37)-N6)-threonylcarbamoyltransferase complex ATPase subunit type 1 TsaE [Patescibacteria group bacterium]